MSVPAADLGLGGKTVKQFYLAAVGGGVWLDAVGVPVTPVLAAPAKTSRPGEVVVTATGAPYTFLTAGPLPAGMVFADDGKGTGRLSGTPTAPGTYTITITAEAGPGPVAARTVTVKVVQAPTV